MSSLRRPLLADALAKSRLVHDAAALQAATEAMANRIHADYPGDEPPLYLTVMNGGMIFAGELALALGRRGMDLEFDTLHATRYRGDTVGSRLAWLHKPQVSLRDRRVLLVDDILDEGHTLLVVKRWCEDQAAKDVRVAVMAWKRHDRTVEGISAEYIGVEVPDAYVFGHGMDYHEQGRNLPDIHALEIG